MSMAAATESRTAEAGSAGPQRHCALTADLPCISVPAVATKNPYGDDLGSLNPLKALADTPKKIQRLAGKWNKRQWERSYAPGKWSARRVMIHLAQMELALTTRVRFALAQDGYVAQPVDQDAWLPADDRADGATALEAYLALRRLNLALFKGLTPTLRKRTFMLADSVRST